MKRILILIFCLTQIWAKPVNWTFDKLLKSANRNNPEILSAQTIVKAAEENIRTYGILPNPQLTVGYYIEPIETKTGPQEFRIGLMQKMPWFGNLFSQKKIAVLQHIQTILHLRKTRLQTERKILSTFFELRYLNHANQILNENLLLIQQIEDVVQTTYSAGKFKHSDVIRVTIEKEKLHDSIREISDQYLVKLFEMSLLVSETIDVLDFQKLPVIPLHGGLSNNPELQIVKIDETIAEWQTKITKFAFLPEISLGVDWVSIKGGDNPLVAKLGMSLPLHFRKNLAQARRSEQIHNTKIAEIQIMTDKLRNQQRALENKISDSKEKQKLFYNKLLPMAKERLSVLKSGYLSGKVSFVDYLDSQKTVFDFQLNLAKTERDYRVAETQLLKLSGQSILGENKNE